MDYTDIFNFVSHPALLPFNIAASAAVAGYAFAEGAKGLGIFMSALTAFNVAAATAHIYTHVPLPGLWGV